MSEELLKKLALRDVRNVYAQIARLKGNKYLNSIRRQAIVDDMDSFESRLDEMSADELRTLVLILTDFLMDVFEEIDATYAAASKALDDARSDFIEA